MRVLTSGVALWAAIALMGCGTNESAVTSFAQAPRANVVLHRSAATLTQTSDTQWTLTKTGSTGGASVTWAITATEGTTTAGSLIYNGIFKVNNKGNAGATIGNIVVNLQTKTGNKWITRSSVIADATQDDAATHANISPGGSSEGRSSFDENSASGKLLFTDAATNSTFALVPEVTVPPGTITELLFTASFDNNVLQLPVGTQTRAEIIVSFGNAKQGGQNSSANVDINGNGIIDADEAWVQSVDDHPAAAVPAQTPSNVVVTLADSPSDITTTGTVTFSNPQINLDQTSHTGTVVVNYDGGANGGTITNCAHLTSSGQTQTVTSDADTAIFPNVLGVDLTACDTQVIGAHVCMPGRPGCGWTDGDMTTHTQAQWGDPLTAAGASLTNYFATVYFSTGGLLVGTIPTYNMTFDSEQAIFDYQPAAGAPAALNANLANPTTSASGSFGGEVVGLKLNIDFSDNNLLASSTGLHFGDLLVCGVNAAIDGGNVRSVFGYANTALGGGSAPLSITDLNTIAAQLNASFGEGAVSVFAQQHLFTGSCP